MDQRKSNKIFWRTASTFICNSSPSSLMVFEQEHSLDIPQYGPTLQISDLTPSITASGSPYKKFVDCFPLDKSDSYGSQEVGEKKEGSLGQHYGENWGLAYNGTSVTLARLPLQKATGLCSINFYKAAKTKQLPLVRFHAHQITSAFSLHITDNVNLCLACHDEDLPLNRKETQSHCQV